MIAGESTLNAAQNAIYSLPSSDFHDITSGSNGQYSATTGYDEVTGRGSPIASLVISGLEAYTGTSTTSSGSSSSSSGSGSTTSGSSGNGSSGSGSSGSGSSPGHHFNGFYNRSYFFGGFGFQAELGSSGDSTLTGIIDASSAASVSQAASTFDAMAASTGDIASQTLTAAFNLPAASTQTASLATGSLAASGADQDAAHASSVGARRKLNVARDEDARQETRVTELGIEQGIPTAALRRLAASLPSIRSLLLPSDHDINTIVADARASATQSLTTTQASTAADALAATRERCRSRAAASSGRRRAGGARGDLGVERFFFFVGRR